VPCRFVKSLPTSRRRGSRGDRSAAADPDRRLPLRHGPRADDDFGLAAHDGGDGRAGDDRQSVRIAFAGAGLRAGPTVAHLAP
jgi:hypothetical protein